MYNNVLNKASAIGLIACLICEQSGFAQVAPQLALPAYLQNIAPVSEQFRPMHIRSIEIDPEQDNYNMILDKGDAVDQKPEDVRETAVKLAGYFEIGLRLPNSMFWVNLRPDAPTQIIDPDLAKTDVGKILLEADLQLKKDLARFTSPDTKEGRQYWDKLYAKAESLFGMEDVEIPTLTRPWIVPGEIILGQNDGKSYIYKATLKVMLEQDYLKDSSFFNFDDKRLQEINAYSSRLIREIILPKLTAEINASKRYAGLRQVYYSLIAAQWYKKHSRDMMEDLAEVADSRDLSGLASAQPWSADTYYAAYRRSFSEGEYDRTETINGRNGVAIRRYTSGGIAMADIARQDAAIKMVPLTHTPSNNDIISLSVPSQRALTPVPPAPQDTYAIQLLKKLQREAVFKKYGTYNAPFDPFTLEDDLVYFRDYIRAKYRDSIVAINRKEQERKKGPVDTLIAGVGITKSHAITFLSLVVGEARQSVINKPLLSAVFYHDYSSPLTGRSVCAELGLKNGESTAGSLSEFSNLCDLLRFLGIAEIGESLNEGTKRYAPKAITRLHHDRMRLWYPDIETYQKVRMPQERTYEDIFFDIFLQRMITNPASPGNPVSPDNQRSVLRVLDGVGRTTVLRNGKPVSATRLMAIKRPLRDAVYNGAFREYLIDTFGDNVIGADRYVNPDFVNARLQDGGETELQAEALFNAFWRGFIGSRGGPARAKMPRTYKWFYQDEFKAYIASKLIRSEINHDGTVKQSFNIPVASKMAFKQAYSPMFMRQIKRMLFPSSNDYMQKKILWAIYSGWSISEIEAHARRSGKKLLMQQTVNTDFLAHLKLIDVEKNSAGSTRIVRVYPKRFQTFYPEIDLYGSATPEEKDNIKGIMTEIITEKLNIALTQEPQKDLLTLYKGILDTVDAREVSKWPGRISLEPIRPQTVNAQKNKFRKWGEAEIKALLAGNHVVPGPRAAPVSARDGGSFTVSVGTYTPDRCNVENAIGIWQSAYKVESINLSRAQIKVQAARMVSAKDLLRTQPKITAIELAERIVEGQHTKTVPIVVWKDEGGKMYVADGHHRLSAAILRGENRIDAVIVEPPESYKGLLKMTREKPQQIGSIDLEYEDASGRINTVALDLVTGYEVHDNAVTFFTKSKQPVNERSNRDGGNGGTTPDKAGIPIIPVNGYDISTQPMKLYGLRDCIAVTASDGAGNGVLAYLSPYSNIEKTMEGIWKDLGANPSTLDISVIAGFYHGDTRILSTLRGYLSAKRIEQVEEDISDDSVRNIMFDPASGKHFDLEPGTIIADEERESIKREPWLGPGDEDSMEQTVAVRGRLIQDARGWQYVQTSAASERTGVQRPLVDNAVDPVLGQEWIKAHPTDALKAMAATILGEMNHIPQEEFEQALKETIDDMSVPGQIEKPVLVVIRENKSGQGKSNRWVYDIAVERGWFKSTHPVVAFRDGIRDPDAAGSRTEIGKTMRNNTSLDVVIFDDASFSGDQLIDTLARAVGPAGPKGRTVTVHIVVPFMTNHAASEIAAERLRRFPNLNVVIHKHRIVPTVAEIFARLIEQDEQKYRPMFEMVQKVYHLTEQELSRKTLTYFDHKLPDSISMLSSPGFGTSGVIDGIVVNEEGRILATMPFIPPTEPPYSENYSRSVENLRNSHWKTRVREDGTSAQRDGGRDGKQLLKIEIGVLTNKQRASQEDLRLERTRLLLALPRLKPGIRIDPLFSGTFRDVLGNSVEIADYGITRIIEEMVCNAYDAVIAYYDEDFVARTGLKMPADYAGGRIKITISKTRRFEKDAYEIVVDDNGADSLGADTAYKLATNLSGSPIYFGGRGLGEKILQGDEATGQEGILSWLWKKADVDKGVYYKRVVKPGKLGSISYAWIPADIAIEDQRDGGLDDEIPFNSQAPFLRLWDKFRITTYPSLGELEITPNAISAFKLYVRADMRSVFEKLMARKKMRDKQSNKVSERSIYSAYVCRQANKVSSASVDSKSMNNFLRLVFYLDEKPNEPLVRFLRQLDTFSAQHDPGSDTHRDLWRPQHLSNVSGVRLALIRDYLHLLESMGAVTLLSTDGLFVKSVDHTIMRAWFGKQLADGGNAEGMGGIDLRTVTAAVSIPGTWNDSVARGSVVSVEELKQQWQGIIDESRRGGMPYEKILAYVTQCKAQKADDLVGPAADYILGIMRVEENYGIVSSPQLIQALSISQARS